MCWFLIDIDADLTDLCYQKSYFPLRLQVIAFPSASSYPDSPLPLRREAGDEVVPVVSAQVPNTLYHQAVLSER